jgi:hypothetical protein
LCKKLGIPPGGVEIIKSGISVDNHEFSTLSTGFSTRVFHTDFGRKIRVVFFVGRHNIFAYLSTNSYFFRPVHFDHGVVKMLKKDA